MTTPDATSPAAAPPQPPKPPRVPRPGWLRVAKWAGIGAGGLVLLLVVLFGLLQTGPVKRMVMGIVFDSALEGEELTVSFADVEGFFPFTIAITDVTVADSRGPVLTLARWDMDWQPLALLDGSVVIDTLIVSDAELLRLPPTAEDTPAEPFEFVVPELGSAFEVDRFALQNLTVGQAVAGEAATLAVEGRASLSPGRQGGEVQVTVDRVDGAGGRLELLVVRAPDTDDLSIELHLRDPAGGAVTRTAGLPGLPPVTLDLVGNGPLAAWSGRLTASAGPSVSLDADLRLGVTKTVTMSLEGAAVITGLLPPEVAPLVPPRLGLAADLAFVSGGRISVDNLALTAPGQSVVLQLAFDPADGAIEGTTKIDLDDAAPLLAQIVPDLAAGAVALDARLAGTLQQPVLALDATVQDLRTPEAGARSVELHLRDIAARLPEEAAPGLPQSVALQADGRLVGVTVSADLSANLGVDPAPLLAQPVDWSFAGTVDLAAGAAAIDGLQLALGDIALFLAGTVSDGFTRADAALTLDAADIAPLAAMAGVPAYGPLSLDAELTGDLGGGSAGPSAIVVLGGDLSGIATGLPGADAVLAEAGGLSGMVTLQDGVLRLDAVELSGAGTRLAVNGSVAESGLDIAFDAALDDLGLLAGLAGQPLGGAAALSGTVSGSLDDAVLGARIDGRGLAFADIRLASLGGTLSAANLLGDPTARAELQGRTASVAGTVLDRVDLEASASGLATRPQGRLAVEVARADATLSAQSAFDLPPDGSVRLNGLTVSGSGLALAGDIRLDGGIASGRLAGQTSDLAALGRLADLPLAGSLTLAIDLAAEGGRQSVAAEVEVAGMTLAQPDAAPLSLDRLSLSARVADATGTPQLSAEAAVAGLRQDDLTVATGTLWANGDLRALDFEASVEGERREPFTVAAGGALALTDSTGLRLDKLDVTYGGQPFRLLQPATVAWSDNVIAVSGLRASAGEGQVGADLRFAPDAVAASIDIKALPLSLVAAFTPGLDATGTVDATLTLSGAPSSPDGQAQLRFAGLRAGALEGGDLAALGGVVDATLRNGYLEAKAALDNPPGVTLQADIGMPFAISLAPIAVALDPAAPLSGRVDGAFDLSIVPELVDLRGDNLAGRLEARLALGGTVGAPDASGEARILGGSYESADLGTVVRNLEAVVAGSRSEIVLRSLTATDGEDGRLDASGTLALDGDRGFPFSMTASLDEFHVLRRDDATVAADGRIAVESSAEGGRIGGAVTVSEAELRIPEGLPASIVKLDVVEINVPPELRRAREARAAEAEAAAASAQASAAAPWLLDLTVDLPGQVFVRGRGLTSEWRGNLAITGTASAPDIVGRLEAVRGQFDLLGRTLVLDRGVITFTGGTVIDPTLDILTTAEAEGMIAELRIGGSVQRPTFEMGSDTGLPQDQVLAVLLFGRRLEQLTPVEAVQLASAAATLSGTGPSLGLLDEIRQTVGLDFLGVATKDEGEPVVDPAAPAEDEPFGGALGGSSLRAGQYLTEDVFVRVDQGLTPESRRVGVEVRVLPETLPDVTVDSDVGADGRTSFGLNWKYDY